jgi:hypothetical protein
MKPLEQAEREQLGQGHRQPGAFVRDLHTAARMEGAFSVASLAGKPIPEREWAVHELIPWKSVCLFSAHGGDGKSTLALQLAIAATLGEPWLGIPTRHCRVGVVSCEDDTAEVHRRLAAICEGEGYSLANLDIEVFDRVGRANGFMEKNAETGWRWSPTPWFVFLMRWATDKGVQFLILDSLYNFFDGNQLDMAAAHAFMGLLRELSNECDGTVMTLWHPSQSGRESGDGGSGSNAFHNAARSRLFMRRDEDDPDIRIIANMKQNYAATAGEIRVRWEEGRFVRIDQPGRGGTVERIERQVMERKVLDALEDALAAGEAPSRAIEARSNYLPKLLYGRPKTKGLGEREIERAMRDMIAAGALVIGWTEDSPSRRRKILVPAGHPLAAGPDATPSDTPSHPTDRGTDTTDRGC